MIVIIIVSFTYHEFWLINLQDCNNEWKSVFEQEFNLSTTDFYDFPLHPAVLDRAGFVTFCNISKQRTQCYINECNDQASFYLLCEIYYFKKQK